MRDFFRNELATTTNSEAIIIIVDIGNVVLIIIDEIFFVDFQIEQVMSIVVLKDVIHRACSCFKLAVELNQFSFYDCF